MKPIADWQKSEIEALFDTDYRDYKFEFGTSGDRYEIRVSQMYEYVEFADNMSPLVGYQKIAAILGCTEGREADRDYEPGCETCDWGSKYTVTLEFWNPMETTTDA